MNSHSPALSDEHFMARAITLAARGLYTTMPNPRVGCVLVKEGQVIGEGFHQRAGEGHAEVNALAAADPAQVRGATAYVSLEPCSHHGRTGPCCEALVAAGIARLVVAMQDPNPAVAGRGIAFCEAAGIDVKVGVCEAAAQQLNAGFIKRMQRQQPFVRVKLAASLDGRTAMASGESKWITGPAARRQVQRLRARSSAIISGVDAVIADDSRLTVRESESGLSPEQAGPAPLRVVIDSQLRLPPAASMLSAEGRTLIFTTERREPQMHALTRAGAEVIELAAADDGHVSLAAVLSYLASTESCNEVLVESGAGLAGAFMAQQLVDELVIFMAPTLLGSTALPLFDMKLAQMSEQQRLIISDVRAVGDDWQIIARPA
ncbi:Riboflavin biosynthesis protein RibD [Carnimonas sp. R-84981]|uniref:bifunctional diaminohydroxyphosphoribosylaminopyrimidine deaminase/5-amino-6-(5-phosphoribosylamino)uracil reductase RibD n=1 Tax=Carnimonas bestiolae TaxID=3402172 RepID=UPI003EDBE753